MMLRGFVAPASVARRVAIIVALLATPAAAVGAATIAAGAAPKGDRAKVASRIIKYNFPGCKRVTSAVRQADGSIRAACDGIDYLVFTVFNAKEGKLIELALNCAVAAKMNIRC